MSRWRDHWENRETLSRWLDQWFWPIVIVEVILIAAIKIADLWG